MAENYRTILFDLDGTLTDSSPGIINSVKYALVQMNWEIPDEKTLNEFLGPPMKDSMMNYCGMSEAQAEEARSFYFLRYSGECCVTENSLYDGIKEVLEKLYASGKKLALATSKPQVTADRIVSYFDLKQYFWAVCGSNPDGSDGKKSDIIKKALAACGERELEAAVMVGDRFYDIEGAKEAGIASIGAEYGYSVPGELENAGADYIANNPIDILKILNGGI